MSQDTPRQAINMEKPLAIAWVGPQVGQGRVSGNHHSGANSVNQFDGDSDMASASWLCVERAQKRNSGLCQHLFLEKAAHTGSCPNTGQFSFSSYASGAFQAAAPVLEFRGSKSMHCPFKRNCLGFQEPSVSFSLNPHWYLEPEVIRTPLPGTGNLGLALCSSGETSRVEISS